MSGSLLRKNTYRRNLNRVLLGFLRAPSSNASFLIKRAQITELIF